MFILVVRSNPLLTSVAGFDSVMEAGQVVFDDNQALTSIEALTFMSSIESLQIRRCAIRSPPFPALRTAVNVVLEENPLLESLAGLGALEGGPALRFTIKNNPGLTTLDGLAPVSQAEVIDVTGSPNLSDVDALLSLRTIAFLRICAPLVPQADLDAIRANLQPGASVVFGGSACP